MGQQEDYIFEDGTVDEDGGRIEEDQELQERRFHEALDGRSLAREPLHDRPTEAERKAAVEELDKALTEGKSFTFEDVYYEALPGGEWFIHHEEGEQRVGADELDDALSSRLWESEYVDASSLVIEE